MTEAFPEASVDPPEDLVMRMTNEPGDRHVLATAVYAECDGVVTANVRDFSPDACEPWGIDIYTPDEFLALLHDDEPEAVLEVIALHAGGLGQPPMTVSQLIEVLGRYAPEFARRLDAQLSQYHIEEYVELLARGRRSARSSR